MEYRRLINVANNLYILCINMYNSNDLITDILLKLNFLVILTLLIQLTKS